MITYMFRQLQVSLPLTVLLSTAIHYYLSLDDNDRMTITYGVFTVNHSFPCYSLNFTLTCLSYCYPHFINEETGLEVRWLAQDDQTHMCKKRGPFDASEHTTASVCLKLIKNIFIAALK